MDGLIINDSDHSHRDAEAAAQQAEALLVGSPHVLPHQRLDVIQHLLVVLHQLILVALAHLDLPLQHLRHLVPQSQQLLRLGPDLLRAAGDGQLEEVAQHLLPQLVVFLPPAPGEESPGLGEEPVVDFQIGHDALLEQVVQKLIRVLLRQQVRIYGLGGRRSDFLLVLQQEALHFQLPVGRCQITDIPVDLLQDLNLAQLRLAGVLGDFPL